MHTKLLSCAWLHAARPELQSAIHPRARLCCQASSGSRGHRRKARRPGQFEVKVVSPPPRTLGIHSFPPDTHNGDQIEVEGQDYVVDSVTLHYRLVGGKYERDHNQLAVQSTSRFFLNKHLDQLYTKSNSQKL